MDYRYESNRLYSYWNWPLDWKSTEVTPRTLAAAGFYYIGILDAVKCFHCVLGIYEWEPRDNPWENHLRHNPSCQFIRGEPCGNVPLINNAIHYFPPPNQQIVTGPIEQLNPRPSSINNLTVSLVFQKFAEAVFSIPCKICKGGTLQVKFLPCQHVTTCAQCAEHLKRCHICKKVIKERVPLTFE